MSRALRGRIVTYKIEMAIVSRKHINKNDVHACTKLLRCCAIALIDEKGTWGGVVQMDNSIEEYNTAVSGMSQ